MIIFSLILLKIHNEFFIFQQKLMTLLSEISSEPETKTIIFVETKRRVDEITRAVCRNGWKACGMCTSTFQKIKIDANVRFY